jgi:hypothetical protein
MRANEFITESENSREFQHAAWQTLPSIMKKAGVDFTQTRELRRGDSYPTLGFINLQSGAKMTASATPGPEGTASITFHIDVSTSNELHRTPNPERVERITQELAPTAQAIGATVVPYNNRHAPHQHMAPDLKLSITLPVAQSQSIGRSAPYNPRDRFMSQPGEMARQSRVARSAYSDSFGGDASNYRR